MIHVPGKLIFIHIPRTGGTSIREAVKQAFPNAIENLALKHCTAWNLRWDIPLVEWEQCVRFTVIRNPYETIESDWRFWHAAGKLYPTSFFGSDELGRRKLIRVVSSDFPTYVRNEWLGRYSPLMAGGFRRTYCYGPSGEDIGVEVLRFEKLNEDWNKLCERLDIKVPLQKLNSMPREPVVWPEAERRAIAELCWMDFQL